MDSECKRKGWYRTFLMERRSFSGSRETSCKGRLDVTKEAVWCGGVDQIDMAEEAKTIPCHGLQRQLNS